LSIAKNSIIKLVWAFFLFSVVVINIALVLEYKRQVDGFYHFTFQRFIMAIRFIHDEREDIEKQLNSLHVKIATEEKKKLLEYGEFIKEDPFSIMIKYGDKLFFVPQEPSLLPPFKKHFLDEKHPMPRTPPKVILENTQENSSWQYTLLVLCLNGVMILFFVVVLKKLLRLNELKDKIREVGLKSEFTPIKIQSHDELAQIGAEFNSAMKKIYQLKEARTLFLRNILHEIKTPIMKGKILTQAFENSQKKEQMQRVFERLEYLLVEMAKVEKLSSDEVALEKKEYRVVDILDHAIDLLMSESSRIEVILEEETPLLQVDFELFSTALKNLLENAIKYSSGTIYVYITKSSMRIESFGEEIEADKLDFSKIFNRKIEGASSGLGLGLYIVNEIVKKHDLKLSYEYKMEKNIFQISF
jgi:two-component system OmpR family sensor kinase